MTETKHQATHSLSAPNIKGVWLILAFIASSILGYASPHDNTASRVSAPDGKYTIEYTATQKISPKLKGHSPYDKNYADPECDFEVISHTFDPNIGRGVITLDRPIKVLATGAFAGINELTSITIPESVRVIKSGAFAVCDRLTYLHIPDTVTEIQEGAFMRCENLAHIRLSQNITHIAAQLFYQCPRLKEVTIPEGVTDIEYMAFFGCESLKSIDIPDSVTHIGHYILTMCDSLESITGKYATDDSRALIFDNRLAGYACRCKTTSFTIPEGVTYIESGVMNGCEYVTSIVIGESVEHIGSGALACPNLKSVYCNAPTPPQTEKGSFHRHHLEPDGREYYATKEEMNMRLAIRYIYKWAGLGSDKEDLTIYVPSESIEQYKEAEEWSTYKDRYVGSLK